MPAGPADTPQSDEVVGEDSPLPLPSSSSINPNIPGSVPDPLANLGGLPHKTPHKTSHVTVGNSLFFLLFLLFFASLSWVAEVHVNLTCSGVSKETRREQGRQISSQHDQ